MSLFSKLNQIKELKVKAKTLQNALAEEKVTVEKHGTVLIMDGNQKVINLNIAQESLKPENKKQLEETILFLQNEAIGKVQKIMVEKMRNNPNFNIPGLT